MLAGCGKSGGTAGNERPPAAVTVNQPVLRDVVEWDEYPGRLEAVDMVEVRARVNGYLQSINFKDGAEVKKGDLLFVIDPRPYQAELDRATADLLQATFRETDVIARIGGDEFAVAGQFSHPDIAFATERLREACALRNVRAGNRSHLSFSVGHVTTASTRSPPTTT